jgi:predicted transcriptional regulator
VTTSEKLTTKELVRRALDHLPDDVTMPEVIERLDYLYQIQLGLDDLDAGRTVPHEEVKRQMAKWLT